MASLFRSLCCCLLQPEADGIAAPLLHARPPPRAPLPPQHGAAAWRAALGSEVVDRSDAFEAVLQRTLSPLLRRPTSYSSLLAPKTSDGALRCAGSGSGSQEDDNACPTCLEAYTADQPPSTLHCGHAFHLACILSWSETGRDDCPLCGAAVCVETHMARIFAGDDTPASNDDQDDAGYATPPEEPGAASGYSSAEGTGGAVTWHDARSGAQSGTDDEDVSGGRARRRASSGRAT
jgi:hypothetical protein